MPFFRKRQAPKPPETNTVAQPVAIGGKPSDRRLLERVNRLFLWFEQREGDAPREKVEEMRAALKKHCHALAGRGYPFFETKEQLEEALSGNSNS